MESIRSVMCSLHSYFDSLIHKACSPASDRRHKDIYLNHPSMHVLLISSWLMSRGKHALIQSARREVVVLSVDVSCAADLPVPKQFLATGYCAVSPCRLLYSALFRLIRTKHSGRGSRSAAPIGSARPGYEKRQNKSASAYATSRDILRSARSDSYFFSPLIATSNRDNTRLI
jgi:hypothetical protein